MSGYESRMYRQTLYSNERLTIYNERNGTSLSLQTPIARYCRRDCLLDTVVEIVLIFRKHIVEHTTQWSKVLDWFLEVAGLIPDVA